MKKSFIQPGVIVMTAFCSLVGLVCFKSIVTNYPIWKDNIQIVYLPVAVFAISFIMLFLIVRPRKGWIWEAWKE